MKPPKKSRSKHALTDEQDAIIIKFYNTMHTKQEKLDLCHKIGVDDIRILYNAACRLGLTRKNEDLSNTEFHKYMAGDKTVLQLKQKLQQQDEQFSMNLRQDPETFEWTKEDEKFLIRNFGELRISQIAFQRGHSEAAIMYHARKTIRPAKKGEPSAPLRKPAVGFLIEKVCTWLGLSEEEFKDLAKTYGVKIHPLPNMQNKPQNLWVIARTLAPMLEELGEHLIEKNDADKFFILEILETDQELEQGKTTTEGCIYLNHGHVCNNHWAGPCYGLFCDGEDKDCDVRNMPLRDLR